MKVHSVKKINFIVSLAAFSLILVFGIVFLIFASKLSQQKIPDNYVETEAKITRIEKELLPGHTPSAGDLDMENYEFFVFVEYSWDGETYSDREYGNYDSSMKEGDTVLLYLNPDDPAEFISDPSGSFIFVIIGIVITLVGVGGIGYFIYKKKRGMN